MRSDERRGRFIHQENRGMHLLKMTPEHVIALANVRMRELQEMLEKATNPEIRSQHSFWLGAWGSLMDMADSAKSMEDFSNRALKTILDALETGKYDDELKVVTIAQEARKRAS